MYIYTHNRARTHTHTMKSPCYAHSGASWWYAECKSACLIIFAGQIWIFARAWVIYKPREMRSLGLKFVENGQCQMMATLVSIHVTSIPLHLTCAEKTL